MNYKQLSCIYTDEYQFSREKLQFFFDKAFLNTEESNLHSHYRALRNLEFDTTFDFIPETVNLSSLCENLTTAFDVLSANSGVSFIYCGNDTASVHGNYRLITKAFLNLLSNAYLYGTASLVTVKTVESADHIKVEVNSGGCFRKSTHQSKGLLFVRKVCKSMNGHFFIETNSDSSKSIMIFNKQNISVKHDDKDFSFTNLLTDRLSPVYVEIFGMEYH